MKTLIYNQGFTTEKGANFPSLEIAYDTWGTLNSEADNVIWVCHALTANSDVESWWPGMVGIGKLLDPEKFFIVCANVLGSCYGTTGPASVNPSTGSPWLKDFPAITIRDLVNVHEILRKFLGIRRIHTVVGSSIGGFQSLEYSIMFPEIVERLVFVASSAKQSPWALAFSQSQRLAMEADASFVSGEPDGGKAGLKAARSIALLSYRNSGAYNETQKEEDDNKTDCFRAASYQNYQGEKLVRRFNPYSYYSLVNLSDTHNAGRGRGGVVAALASVKARTICIGIRSDILFPVEEQKLVAENVPGATYIEIDSAYGHDGFLIEVDRLSEIVREFWKSASITIPATEQDPVQEIKAAS